MDTSYYTARTPPVLAPIYLLGPSESSPANHQLLAFCVTGIDFGYIYIFTSVHMKS